MSRTLPTPPTRSSGSTVPRLNNGDHLSSDEFMRRYEAMPEGTKAELLGGIVFMSPPVRYESHGRPHAHLSAWLVHYAALTQGVGVADNSTTRLDDDNPQPDLSLLLPSHLGGKTSIDKRDYINGPPALVCEIAGSSANIDLHLKKELYAASGITEYVVWRTEDQVIDWFKLDGNQYVALAPHPDGTLRSEIFPGLWLRSDDLIKSDLTAVFRLLDISTASPEHAEFVRRLAQQ